MRDASNAALRDARIDARSHQATTSSAPPTMPKLSDSAPRAPPPSTAREALAAKAARLHPLPMPSWTQKPSRAWLLLLGALSACQQLDLPPLEYQTERARIGTDFDDPLCAGDLRWFDERIADIEVLAGAERPTPVEVYIYADSPPCDRSPFGCYKPDEDIILAIWPFVDHEMVHAVTDRTVRFPSRFWDEGVAEALTEDGTTIDRGVTLTPEMTRSNERPNYAVAGHFVRFLYEDFGGEAARRLIDGAPPEETVGLSLEELTALYEPEAPFSYAARNPCPEPVVPRLNEDTWESTYNFSCESPDATQFEGLGAGVVRILELDQPGDYDVLIKGGDGVRIVGCQMENTDEELPWFFHGDVMNQAELDQTAFGTFFEADVEHRLTLTEGRYRLALTSGHNDDAEVSVKITKR
jgi:hypothetical protein